MHTLGFHHEQARSDRDEYITVQKENIDSETLHNFQKANTLNKTPYDMGSIMQYFLSVSDGEHMENILRNIYVLHVALLRYNNHVIKITRWRLLVSQF